MRKLLALLMILAPLSPGFVSAQDQPAKWRFFCPSAAGEHLQAFRQFQEADASTEASLVTKDKTSESWGYARIKVERVPGLTDNNLVDPDNPHSVHMILYPQPSAANVGRTSLWGHIHDNGEYLDIKYLAEHYGFSNLDPMKADMAKKGFMLIEFSGQGFRTDESIFTNTLFMSPGDRPASYLRVRQISEQVLHSLSVGPNGFSSSDRAVLATVRTAENEELVVVFDLDESKKMGVLSGGIMNLTKNGGYWKEVLQNKFSRIGSAGRVYIYGDNLTSLNLVGMCEAAGNEVVRRSITTVKDFNRTDKRLNSISARSLEPANVAFAHGTPNNADEIAKMGFPSLSLERWQQLYKNVENRMAGRFSARIDSKAELLRELSSGNHDVVFVVAHADKGKSLFLGGEEISFDELKSLPDRYTLGPHFSRIARPRTAVLLSCFAGDLSEARRQFFRTELQSFAEILVNKNYFDEVLAPPGEIGEETPDLLPQVLTRLQNGLHGNIEGLLRIAAVKRQEPGVLD